MFDRLLFSSLPALFSLLLFVSAGLLFSVELMIAKLILPQFGGTPAVWNTCMMFFQGMLLAGYGYAHLTGTRARLGRQIAIQLALLAAALVVLPVAIPRGWAQAAGGSPVAAILLMLLVSVGLPFFALSSMAPLVQKWFARTGHPSAGDPYFLYSASNLGSMLALIGYPLLVEPHVRLVSQGRAWAVGYALMVGLTALCAFLTRRYARARASGEGGGPAPGTAGSAAVAAPPPPAVQGRWVLLAFVPSSMMLGVTTFLSTDVASFPLFWIVPLSLYLLSFIIVFARVPARLHTLMVRLLPVALAGLLLVSFAETGIPKWAVFVVHLVNFFLCCMVCHGEIARTRPATDHLTQFYLLVSVGGVLGGVFNSLLAPQLFETVLEYPLVLALGALLLPVAGAGRRPAMTWRTLLLYVGVPLALASLTYLSVAEWHAGSVDLAWLSGLTGLSAQRFYPVLTYGTLALGCLALLSLRRPLLFGIAIASVLVTAVLSEQTRQQVVHRERSFFGVLTVTKDEFGRLMKLAHGTTLHGMQWLDPARRLEPVAYYHPDGPAGQLFAEFSGANRKGPIAVAGLGTGSLAAYAGPDDQVDFYEIDPSVVSIASNPEYFTFLSECRARWRVVLGDARLTMEKAPQGAYGIIVLDAFSSDAIPLHLLTREAIGLYLSRLRDGGVLLIHISNKYVNLAPVLARLALELGLAARLCDDDANEEVGKYGTTWVVMARHERDLGGLAGRDGWEPLRPEAAVGVWTDDFSNLLSVFKW